MLTDYKVSSSYFEEYEFSLEFNFKRLQSSKIARNISKEQATVVLQIPSLDMSNGDVESYLRDEIECAEVIVLNLKPEDIIGGRDHAFVSFADHFKDRSIFLNVVFFVNVRKELTANHNHSLHEVLKAMAKHVWDYDITQNEDWIFLNTYGMESHYNFQGKQPYCFKSKLEAAIAEEAKDMIDLSFMYYIVGFALIPILCSIVKSCVVKKEYDALLREAKPSMHPEPVTTMESIEKEAKPSVNPDTVITMEPSEEEDKPSMNPDAGEEEAKPSLNTEAGVAMKSREEEAKPSSVAMELSEGLAQVSKKWSQVVTQLSLSPFQKRGRLAPAARPRPAPDDHARGDGA